MLLVPEQVLRVDLDEQEIRARSRRGHARGRVREQAVDELEGVRRGGRIRQAPVRVHEHPEEVEVHALAVQQRRFRDVDLRPIREMVPSSVMEKMKDVRMKEERKRRIMRELCGMRNLMRQRHHICAQYTLQYQKTGRFSKKWRR